MRSSGIFALIVAGLLISIAAFAFVTDVERTSATDEMAEKARLEKIATEDRQKSEAEARQIAATAKQEETRRAERVAWNKQQELNQEREATAGVRETIATHWGELGDAVIDQCKQVVAQEAQRTATRVDGASAWLVEMPAPLAVCLASERCVKAVASRTETDIRELPADASNETVAQVVKRGEQDLTHCADAPAARYADAVVQTRSLTGAAAEARVRVFAVVLEADPGFTTRVSEKIQARSDSSPMPFQAGLQTPGLDRFDQARAGVFAVVAPEGAEPTWTVSIEVPVEVGGSLETRAGLVSFNIDAFQGGILESLDRVTLPKSQLDQARRQLRIRESELRARAVELASLQKDVASLQNDVGGLNAELARARAERLGLERYNSSLERMLAQHEKDELVSKVAVAVASTATKTLLGWLFKL